MEKLLDFTKPHLLRSPEEYDAAIQEIDRLVDLRLTPGTDLYERLEFLAVLVEAYEDEHFVEDCRDSPVNEKRDLVLPGAAFSLG